MEDKHNRPQKNLYELLGVKKDATKKEIKKAYRDLAKEYHPDKYANATEEVKKEKSLKMGEISAAYSILSDHEERKFYDETGGVSKKISFEMEVQSTLNSILATVISASDIKSSNIIRAVEGLIRKNTQQAREKLSKFADHRKNLIELSKLKCSEKKNDNDKSKSVKMQLQYIINQKTDELKQQKESMDHLINLMDASLEMLKWIMDDDDERVQPVFNYGSMINGGMWR